MKRGDMGKERHLFYYGWVVVAVAFTTLAVAVSMRTSFSIFFPSFLEEFGWKRGVTAIAFSINMIALSLSAPVLGVLMDRYGPRVVMPAGAVILALGMGLSSRITELWQFYLLQGVLVGVGTTTMSFTGHSYFLPNWFARNRGIAMGMAFSGVGVGQALIVPWAQKLILSTDWRHAFIVLGILTAAVLIPLNALLQRHKPQDMGLLPDGDLGPALNREETARHSTVVDEDWVSVDWTLSRAVRTGRFWLVFAAFSLVHVGWYIILVHQVAHIIDVGYTKTLAAYVVGLSGIMMVAGGIVLGHLSDRFGREIIWTVGCAGFLLGALTFMFLKYPGGEWMLYLSLWVLMGFMVGVLAPMSPSISADIFHGANFGSVQGGLMLGSGAGAALGAWLGGYINDATGSYDLAFAVVMISAALAILCVWLAAPRKVRTVSGVAKRKAVRGTGGS
jgi:MFS family permease